MLGQSHAFWSMSKFILSRTCCCDEQLLVDQLSSCGICWYLDCFPSDENAASQNHYRWCPSLSHLHPRNQPPIAQQSSSPIRQQPEYDSCDPSKFCHHDWQPYYFSFEANYNSFYIINNKWAFNFRINVDTNNFILYDCVAQSFDFLYDWRFLRYFWI